jgi:hypothetical protein
MQARPRLLRACRSILPPNSRALHNSNKVDHIGGRKGCSAERWLVFGPGLRKCRQAVSAASEQQMPLEKRPAEDPSIEANDPGLETDSNPIRGNPNNLLQRIAFSLTGRHNVFTVAQFLITCVVTTCLLVHVFAYQFVCFSILHSTQRSCAELFWILFTTAHVSTLFVFAPWTDNVVSRSHAAWIWRH